MTSHVFLICLSIFLYLGIWASIYLCLLPVVEHLIYVVHPTANQEWLKFYHIMYVVLVLLGLYLSFYLTWWW